MDIAVRDHVVHIDATMANGRPFDACLQVNTQCDCSTLERCVSSVEAAAGRYSGDEHIHFYTKEALRAHVEAAQEALAMWEDGIDFVDVD